MLMIVIKESAKLESLGTFTFYLKMTQKQNCITASDIAES